MVYFKHSMAYFDSTYVFRETPSAFAAGLISQRILWKQTLICTQISSLNNIEFIPPTTEKTTTLLTSMKTGVKHLMRVWKHMRVGEREVRRKVRLRCKMLFSVEMWEVELIML